MRDIRKVRATQEKDGDWEEWPYPTETIESVVSGDLRARILRILERADDGTEVRLIETNVSGGYSEYTRETECDIEVRIGGDVAWKYEDSLSNESAMTKFLAKFAESK